MQGDTPRTRGFLRGWLPFAIGSALLLALGGAGFIALEHRADDCQDAELELAELDAVVNRLDALEWRAIASAKVGLGLQRELAANRGRAAALLASLGRRESRASRLVSGRYAAYEHAVDREVDAIRRGRTEEAREIDESEVDPAFDRVATAIGGIRSVVSARAGSSARQSQGLALVTLAFAAIGVAFLTWQGEKARQLRALARREEQLLREDQLRLERANAELAAASRQKSEFLSTMSHEIRTPMNGVLGMLGLILDTPLDADQREFAEAARYSADSLLCIINDILDFSKIEARRLSIEPVPFDLQVTLEDVLDLLSARAAEKGVDLLLRFAPGTPHRFVGDPGRIRQVVLNLAGNAIKFTERGHVLIGVGTAETDRGGILVRIAVEDSGIGIPQDTLPLLFERFQQADASTTRRYGGTGLGLAIAKQLCELMGGTIEASSVVGQGSVFTATLRLAADESAPAAPLPKASLTGVRALVVDDSEINRRVLLEQLSGFGMRAESAAGGPTALAMLGAAAGAGDPFRVAVVDHMMPEMDGEAVGRAVRADRAFGDLAMVLCTSSGRRGEAHHFEAAGFNGYMVKPLRPSLVEETLAVVIGAQEQGVHVPLVTRHRLAEGRTLVAAAEAIPDAGAHARRVLLAEDNVVNQKVAVRMLAKLGCRVDIAANGREAVDLWRRLPYDLVLMDCRMPEMDGLEATREIRRLETGTARHTPIVALTANAMASDREECAASGMDDFVSKPVELATLREVLKRNLGPDIERELDRAA